MRAATTTRMWKIWWDWNVSIIFEYYLSLEVRYLPNITSTRTESLWYSQPIEKSPENISQTHHKKSINVQVFHSIFPSIQGINHWFLVILVPPLPVLCSDSRVWSQTHQVRQTAELLLSYTPGYQTCNKESKTILIWTLPINTCLVLSHLAYPLWWHK